MSVPVSAGGYAYERRRPELGTLHRVVRENLQTLHAATEQGFSTPPSSCGASSSTTSTAVCSAEASPYLPAMAAQSGG